MSKPNSNVSIANASVQVIFDHQTGNVVSLVNKRTGRDYIAAPGLAGLWKIAAPPFYFSSCDQQLGEAQIAGSSKTGQTVTLRYDGLKAEDDAGTMAVILEITATLSPDSDRVLWRATLHNREQSRKLRIESLDFPVISGVGVADNRLTLPVGAGCIVNNVEATLKQYRYYVLDYPCYGSMQWMDYFGKHEGLYLGCHDESLGITRLCLEWDEQPRKGEGISMYFTKYPWLKPGETWTSVEYVTALHDGDWHAGADIYRAWAAPRFPAAQTPDRVKREAGWFSFSMMNNVEGNFSMNATNKELPGIYAVIKDLGYENLWIYNHGGKALLQQNEPNLTQHEQGVEEFRRVIKKLHDKGANAIGCLCYRLMPDESWKDEAIQSESGRLCKEKWASGHNVIMCPASKRWRQFMERVMTDTIGEYGLHGVYLDQSAAQVPQICHNPKHGHENPAAEWGGHDLSFLRELRRVARSKNEDAVLTGEGVVDGYAQAIDVNLSSMGVTDLLGETRTNFLSEWQPYIGTYNPAVYRYTFPGHILASSVPGLVKFEEPKWRHMVNMLFIHGMQFFYYNLYTPFRSSALMSLTDHQKAHLRFLSAMWKRVYPFFSEGEYLDNTGLDVVAAELKGVVYRKDSEILVTLANTAARDLKTKMILNKAIWGGHAPARLTVTDVATGQPIAPDGVAWNPAAIAEGGIPITVKAESIGAVLINSQKR